MYQYFLNFFHSLLNNYHLYSLTKYVLLFLFKNIRKQQFLIVIAYILRYNILACIDKLEKECRNENVQITYLDPQWQVIGVDQPAVFDTLTEVEAYLQQIAGFIDGGEIHAEKEILVSGKVGFLKPLKH